MSVGMGEFLAVVAMLPRIFVQIAAYRDAECQWTVRDLFKQATHPNRIMVGICWQYHPEEDKGLLVIDDERAGQVRLMNVDHKESQGACWARHQVQKLWEGEDYVLQIDSHMRFEPAWDEKLIAMLAACPSEKVVLRPILVRIPRQITVSKVRYRYSRRINLMSMMG